MTMKFTISTNVKISHDVQLPDDLRECREALKEDQMVGFIQSGMIAHLRRELNDQVCQMVAYQREQSGETLMESVGFRRP